MRRLVPLYALAALLVVGSTACTHAPRYDEPGAYRQDYYYYPHAGVYFHLHSGHYYYRDGPSWVRVRKLPQHIYLDHRVRRTLVIADAEPYRRYDVHRERYRRPEGLKYDRENDRAERDHNRRQYGEYHKRSERLKRQRY